MLRKLMILILVGVVFWGFFASNLLAGTPGKITPERIPQDQIVPSSPAPLTGDKGFCTIQSDNDTAAYYIGSFGAGDGVALYMDPTTCGVQNPYPFKVTDVHFYLLDFTGAVWPVEIQVNIRDLNQGYKCNGPNGPGNLLCSQTYTIPIDSASPNMIHLNLDCFCCVYAPFFLEIIYGGTSSPYPSPLLTDGNTNPTDTCDAWFVSQGIYQEWYVFFGSEIGYPIMRTTGYTQSIECDSCWYWKPDTLPQAPSGMPDFDQNQDKWQSYCGPTAVANCLWWFNAVPERWTPPQLIDTLARYFHTDPDSGTDVDSMQIGLEQYFKDYGFALQESTFQMPNFYEMEDSLKKCQDIILLLGFWWYDGQEWHREGGHFVTMAGVCSESTKIALSDPDKDNAESGGAGQVRPPHAQHPADHTLHNNPAFISHDIYNSNLNPQPPSPGNPFWEINYGWGPVKYSGINVPKEFIAVTKAAPKDDVMVVYATEVEYAVMICPKPTAVEEEEKSGITPKDFELYQSYPNPFNNETIIKYDLLKSCRVTLTIYNILGQKVKTLVKERQVAGSKTVSWDGKDEKGRDLATGIYFYQLKAGEVTQTKRMVLLK